MSDPEQFASEVRSVENLLARFCVEDARGNAAIAFIGLPRTYLFTIAMVTRKGEPIDVTGQGSTLMLAIKDFQEKAKLHL